MDKAMARVAVALLALLALPACPAGGGDGWVGGSLWVAQCAEDKPLNLDGTFDLGVDFFAGDLLFDSAAGAKTSRLLVRLQETGSPIQESNSLLIEFLNLGRAAQAFYAREPITFAEDGLCPSCVALDAIARLRLNLFVGCPQNHASIAALPYPLIESSQATATAPACLVPAAPIDAPPTAPCPVLSEADRSDLERLCASDFNDRTRGGEIERLLGTEGACLYLCQFGPARQVRDPAALPGFELDFGQTVAAVFSARVADLRAFRFNQCAGAQGHLTGMFKFKLVRSRVAQPFP